MLHTRVHLSKALWHGLLFSMVAGVDCNGLARVKATFDGLDICMRSLVSGTWSGVSIWDLSMLNYDFVITVSTFCCDIYKSGSDLNLALRDSIIILLSHQALLRWRGHDVVMLFWLLQQVWGVQRACRFLYVCCRLLCTHPLIIDWHFVYIFFWIGSWVRRSTLIICKELLSVVRFELWYAFMAIDLRLNVGGLLLLNHYSLSNLILVGTVVTNAEALIELRWMIRCSSCVTTTIRYRLYSKCMISSSIFISDLFWQSLRIFLKWQLRGTMRLEILLVCAVINSTLFISGLGKCLRLRLPTTRESRMLIKLIVTDDSDGRIICLVVDHAFVHVMLAL